MGKKQKAESLATIAACIGCSRQSIDQLKNRHRADFPARHGHGYYIGEVVEFLVSHAPADKGVHRAAASWRLANPPEETKARKSKGKTAKQTADREAPMAEVMELPPPSEILADGEGSFGDILRQFRAAISEMASFYRQAVLDQDNPSAAFFLGQWNKTFDTLRRAETSVLDIEKQRGSLLSRDEVVSLVVAMVANVRGKLLALPQRLAHELSGCTPGQVSKVLDEEIRDALESLSEDPFGVS